MIFQARGFKVRECIGGQRHKLLFEKTAIGIACFSFAEFADIDLLSPDAEGWTAMRMRGIEQERLGCESVLVAKPLFKVIAQRTRHTDEIECDDQQAVALGVFQRERLRKKILRFAFGG